MWWRFGREDWEVEPGVSRLFPLQQFVGPGDEGGTTHLDVDQTGTEERRTILPPPPEERWVP